MDLKFREDGEINVETRFAGYPELPGRDQGKFPGGEERDETQGTKGFYTGSPYFVWVCR